MTEPSSFQKALGKLPLHQIERTSESSEAEERVPLYTSARDDNTIGRSKSVIGKMADRVRYGSVAQEYAIQRANPPEEMFSTSHNNKVIRYDHNQLLSWSVFWLMGKSVFLQPPVLQTFVFCVSLAVTLATLVYFLPSASKISTARFQILCDFLTVFITFMLGIYVQQAFKHWWCSVTTFEHFLCSIRKLIFMLHQLKIDAGFVKEVEDLCIASTYIFNVEVKNALKFKSSDHQNVHDLIEWLSENRFLTNEEKDYLNFHGTAEGIMSRSRAVWSFIGEMLAHVSDLTEKTLPPPVETRLIAICQECIGEIEELKMNITIQTPFMYAHLLAFLVHVNNFILSATCGICIGSALNETALRSEQLNDLGHESNHQAPQDSIGDMIGGGGGSMGGMDLGFLRALGHPGIEGKKASLTRQFYAAIETTYIKILMVLLGPILHVAFLHIAHLLCYPFGNESYHLPMETLIARLHSELHQMRINRQFFRGTIISRKESNYSGAPSEASPFQEKESPILFRRSLDPVHAPPRLALASAPETVGSDARGDDDRVNV